MCARCKAGFLRRLQEGSSPAARRRYVGFLMRAVAFLLDGFLLSIVTIPLVLWAMLPWFRIVFAAAARGQVGPAAPAPAMSADILFRVIGAEILVFAGVILYRGYMVGRWGATVGKMAIRAQVVPADGRPMTMGRGFGRALAEVISDWTFGIGYLLVAFDERKRALHDMIAGTLVIQK